MRRQSAGQLNRVPISNRNRHNVVIDNTASDVCGGALVSRSIPSSHSPLEPFSRKSGLITIIITVHLKMVDQSYILYSWRLWRLFGRGTHGTYCNSNVLSEKSPPILYILWRVCVLVWKYDNSCVYKFEHLNLV